MPKFLLSEKVLNLQPDKFELWLNNVSVASPESKERYRKAYFNYQTDKMKAEENIEIDYNVRWQTEGAFARKVFYVTTNQKILFLKEDYEDGETQFNNIFNLLYRGKKQTNYMSFHVALYVVKKRKVLRDVEYHVSSKIHAVEDFYNTYMGILGKVEGVMFSESIDGVLVITEAIKFYYHRVKTKYGEKLYGEK